MLRLLWATLGFVGVNPIYRLEVRRWRWGTRALLALGIVCSVLYAPGIFWVSVKTSYLSSLGDWSGPAFIWGPFLLGASVSAVLASLTVVRWRKRGLWDDLLLSLVDRADVLVAVLVPAMRAGIVLLLCLLLGWGFSILLMALGGTGGDASEGIQWLGVIAVAALAAVCATGLGGMLGTVCGLRCRDALHAAVASAGTLLVGSAGLMVALLWAQVAGGAAEVGHLLGLYGSDAADCYARCWAACAAVSLLSGALLWRRLVRWMGGAG